MPLLVSSATLPSSAARLEERRFRMSALLARLRGRVTMSYAAWEPSEGRALARLFGSNAPPVSSTKAVFGHTLGAAGAIEAVVCTLALTRGFLPGTVALEETDAECGIEPLREACEAGLELDSAIVRLHLQFMASYPDSLIARKCGPETARKAAAGAARVLEGGWPEAGTEALFTELDNWLREDGNRRNPGTSADLVAGCLFLALRTGIIALPPSGPASGESPA